MKELAEADDASGPIEPTSTTEPLDSVLLGTLFLVGFVVAYLAIPFNPTIPGTEVQLRPEPLVLILALPFGRRGVFGATAGVLVHDLAFRLGPDITPFFSGAQTLTALVAGLVGAYVWTRLPSPFRAAGAPAAFVAVFVPLLGLASALELRDSPLDEMRHIFVEVLVPQLLLGPPLLAAWELRAHRTRPIRADTLVPRGQIP